MSYLTLLRLAVKRRLLLVTVDGPSMRPTLREGERVWVERVAPGDLRAGHIVVLRRPEPDARLIIKRVAALCGDPVDPAWLPPGTIEPGSVVPQGMLVLLGDNRQCSNDSRFHGFFATNRVLGRVLGEVERQI
jgi:signal peptidase I